MLKVSIIIYFFDQSKLQRITIKITAKERCFLEKGFIKLSCDAIIPIEAEAIMRMRELPDHIYKQ